MNFSPLDTTAFGGYFILIAIVAVVATVGLVRFFWRWAQKTEPA